METKRRRRWRHSGGRAPDGSVEAFLWGSGLVVRAWEVLARGIIRKRGGGREGCKGDGEVVRTDGGAGTCGGAV